MTVAAKTVVIVGGGFSGAIFGLKLHRKCPHWRIVIAEPKKKLGRGVAYGACGPDHLLNVPVSRMEIGLVPSFADWLQPRRAALAEALVESGLDLSAAFVARRFFGDYVEERVNEALDSKSPVGLSSVRGEVVRLLKENRGVLLTDGRQITADIVVLAMGNLPPRPPGGPDTGLYDSGFFIPDPWAVDAFSDIDPAEPLLLIGSGLTTVDIALRLAQQGHRGPLLALSRRGLAPRTHAAGGAWPEFLHDKIPASALVLTKIIRQQIALAASQGVAWQRVFDAARSAVPSVWNGWSEFSRRQFMRHLRPRWDIHRHRMAPVTGRRADLWKSRCACVAAPRECSRRGMSSIAPGQAAISRIRQFRSSQNCVTASWRLRMLWASVWKPTIAPSLTVPARRLAGCSP
jgi:uncharacterized NAD(P)/FAD-binding protein YdhS